MTHITTPEAEVLLDQPIPVLDHGFVRLVDYMGSDARIVQSARVSYGAGTKTLREDKMLIDYLLSNEHMSPFEMVVFTFHLKMPIFVARQLVRHRTARMNEISGRYSEMKDEFYMPEIDRVSFQKRSNRQGSSRREVPGELRERVRDIMAETEKSSYSGYDEMIQAGITRELARTVLPLSIYTEMYWQMDLRNLLHFIKLRLDGHAQYEIRVYAEAMARCVKAVTPLTWEAFEEHVLGAVKLSRSQAAELARELEAVSPEVARRYRLKKEG